MRSGTLGLVVVAVGLGAGCAEPSVPVDASSVSDDAAVDASPAPDAGRCVEEPIEADCWYHGYGSTCGVPCDFTEACTFDVHVTWSDCVIAGSNESFVDCVCIRGIAWCRPAFTPLPRELPTSYCESPWDAGQDAGVDASESADAAAMDSPDAGD